MTNEHIEKMTEEFSEHNGDITSDWLRAALTSAYNAGKADTLEEMSAWGNARMRNFHESELHGKIELMLKSTDQV